MYNRQVLLEDGRQVISFEEFKTEVEKFKEEQIYGRIVDEELRENRCVARSVISHISKPVFLIPHFLAFTDG